MDGAPGSVGPSGKAGADGPPGPPGSMGLEGHDGPVGPSGPNGKDGNPGKDGRDGPPGNPGPAGAAGPPGPEPDLLDLEAAVNNAQKAIKEIAGTTTELTVRNTDLQESAETEVVIIDDRKTEILALLTDVHIEVSQEVLEVAEEVCKDDFAAKVGPCCPNCTKAEYRTPSAEACKEA